MRNDARIYRKTFQSLISLAVAGSLTLGLAASHAIGVASANGAFRIDQAPVARSGTILDGTTIETLDHSSQLDLREGIRIKLAAGSRGRVFGDRLVLEAGQSQMESASPYRVEAGSLRIQTDAPTAGARVTLVGVDRVRVAAAGGGVSIRTSAGLLVARLAPGKALEFAEPPPGAAAVTVVTGLLELRNGRLFLTDETTGVTVELVGPGLEKFVGRRITASGESDPLAKPAAGANHVVRASTWALAEPDRTGPGANPGGGPQTPAAKAGMSGGTKVVIVGVVILSAGVGTAIGLTRSESQPSISQ